MEKEKQEEIHFHLKKIMWLEFDPLNFETPLNKSKDTFGVVTVSARNVFCYLLAFLVIFVFAPLMLFFGSLVFHCPRSFVLRVRVFLHIVYSAFILIFASVLR